MSNIHLFIGHDHREADATAVATYSAKQFSSTPLTPRLLDHMHLRRQQYFDRPWRIDEGGVMWDERDGKPFSTQFSHSRFLTPLLARDEDLSGWALFTDCDVMFLGDVNDLLKSADASKTVMVVKHNYQPKSAVKMDGQPQASYNKKLWSAVMLWNLASKKLPTIEMVNHADGSFLHSFGWLDDSDIGELDEGWHWLPGHSPTSERAIARETEGFGTHINLVHFTTGIPGMADREPTGFDGMFKDFLKDARNAI